MEYCDDEAIRKRLTTAGRKWLTDRNRDGSITDDEIADTITENIAIAGREIDAHLFRRYGLVASIRGQQIPWLRDICIKIAVWYIVSAGGRDSMPGSVQAAYDNALESLKSIRDGQMDVPGLVSNTPVLGPGLTTKTPRIANV
jgi:phage gp36-like protein